MVSKLKDRLLTTSSSTDTSNLTDSQRESLESWHNYFIDKYPIIGKIKDDSEQTPE